MFVAGIPGGSVMFSFKCVVKDANKLVHCKIVQQKTTVLGVLVHNVTSSVVSMVASSKI